MLPNKALQLTRPRDVSGGAQLPTPPRLPWVWRILAAGLGGLAMPVSVGGQLSARSVGRREKAVMDRADILMPVLALACLTLLVLLALGILRVGGIATGRFAQTYYKLFRESENQEPDIVRAMSRNYHNLLEPPILFCAGCLLAYAADLVSQPLVTLAWVFVAFRLVHTMIHVTYNRVWHRMPVFVTSSLVLIGFWVVLGRELLAQG